MISRIRGTSTRANKIVCLTPVLLSIVRSHSTRFYDDSGDGIFSMNFVGQQRTSHRKRNSASFSRVNAFLSFFSNLRTRYITLVLSRTTPIMNNVSLYDRPHTSSFDSVESDAAKQERARMAKSLRRMKRQLLLKALEDNQKPVDSLRDLLWRAASTPPGSPRATRIIRSPPESPSGMLE